MTLGSEEISCNYFSTYTVSTDFGTAILQDSDTYTDTIST